MRDLAVRQRLAADEVPIAGAMLGHRLAVDEVRARAARAIHERADVVQGEGVVMVQRRHVAAARAVQRVVDGM